MHRYDVLEKLTDRIMILPADSRTDRPILAAILGTRRAAMVDAGASPAHAQLFLNTLHQSTGRRPDWVILTHWHWDHTFGLSHLAVPSIGHCNLTRNLQRLQGLSWEDEPLAERVRRGEETAFCAENIAKEYGADRSIDVSLPTITFSNAMTLHLGEVTCELHHLPTDHTDDSVAIYIPEEEALFLGDAMGGNLHTPPYYTADLVLRLTATINRFLARWYVESHSEPANAEEFWAQNRILPVVAEMIRDGVTERDALIDKVQQGLAGALPEDYQEVIGLFFAGTPAWAQPAM